MRGQLEAVRDVLPASTFDLIAARVHDLAAAGRTKLSWGLALSLLVALWSAMNGTKAIISALNVAYEEREKRSLLRLNLVALLFTLGGVGVVLALTVIVVVPQRWPSPGSGRSPRPRSGRVRSLCCWASSCWAWRSSTASHPRARTRSGAG